MAAVPSIDADTEAPSTVPPAGTSASAIGGEFVYGKVVPASYGLKGFSNAKAMEVTSS